MKGFIKSGGKVIIASRVSISMFIVFFYFISIASAQTDENNSISGHEPTNKSDIKVALDHIFVSKKNNSIEISETVVFRNEGQEIYYSKDNHTFFAISTPPDAKNLKTQAMECCLVQEEGIVFMDPMQPIKPWENFEMQISYTIIPQCKEYVFNKSAIYNTTSLSMFVEKKSGLSPEGSYDTITLAGVEYDVVSFNDLSAGERVSIPVKMTEETDYLIMGIGLFFLFSTGLVYLFRRIIKRGRIKEHTLEELELEKRKIFQTIYGFEKHAGTERSEELRNIIEEYRQKAIQIFIKIDKLKDKGQYELLQKGMKHT